ncbi:MAG TPA: hypothetical protein VIT44_08340 [Cyclobacteriaceae bacterium]
MSTEKRLGIWMDHAKAHLMEFTTEQMEDTIIASRFTHQEKEQTLEKSENIMHNKEQHQHAEYYKKIGEEIKKYDEVILFGPTNAKSELLNTLNGDHHFDKIKIHVQQTDKLTENQQHAFVRDYFSKN